MDKKIKLAVVGLGYWGPNLVRNLRGHADCEVKWVCDLDEKRLEHITNLYPGVVGTTDFDDILENGEVDAVAIATPVYKHYEMGMKALKAGKHAFIEKPMASSVSECRELVETAAKKNLTLMVGHTFIYSSPVRKIKEIVESGELGDIYYIASRRLNLGLFQQDINVTWDLAPHDISIILYIFGQPPKSVNCQGKSHVNPNIEDVTNMTLDFDNGGFATIHSSWLDPNKIREMIFVGSKKMLVYDDNQPLEKIKIYDKRVEAPPKYDTYAEFHYSYHYGDMLAPYIQQQEPLKVETRHFLDCIKSGEKPLSSGMEGLRVIQILEASSKSLKAGGGRVEIEDVVIKA